MKIKVAINGFGRIGRTILRAHYENKKKHDLEIIAINGSGNAEDNAHLLKYDSTHGKFNEEVKSKENYIFINKDKSALYLNECRRMGIKVCRQTRM